MQSIVPIFLSLAWLQPLHVLPWVSWHSEALAFVGIAACFAAQVWGSGGVGVSAHKVPSPALLMLGLALLVWGQWCVGKIVFFGDAVVLTLYLVVSAMAISVGAHWTMARTNQTETSRENGDALLNFAMGVAIAAVLSVFLALIQSLDVWGELAFLNRTEGFRRPGANFGQANHLGTLLLMGIASIIFLFEEKKLSASMLAALLALLLVGLVLSESRTAYIGTVLLTLWWLVKRDKVSSQVPPAAVAGSWLCFGVLVYFWPTWVTNFHFPNEILGQIVPVNTSAGARGLVWPQLLDAALLHPWSGWGLRELTKAHAAVLHQYQSSEPFSYAHNIILDMVIGLGFPLAVLLVLLFCAWLYKCARAVATLPSWYCIAICLPITIHSLLEYPFAYAYFLFPFMLAVGLLHAELAPKQYVHVAAWATRGFFLITAAVLLWCAIEYVQVEEDFRVARFEALHVGSTAEGYERPHIVVLTQLNTMLIATRSVARPAMPAEEIEMLRNAALRFPWTAIQNRYALSLALNGDMIAASRQLKVMRTMYGAKHYAYIRAKWMELARGELPQLKAMIYPE